MLKNLLFHSLKTYLRAISHGWVVLKRHQLSHCEDAQIQTTNVK